MPDSTEPTRSPIAARVTFVAVALVLPVELAVQWQWSEPYPALTQPAFAFSAAPLAIPDTLPKLTGVVSVTFTDGHVHTYTAEDLLGWTAGVSPTTILRDTIIEPENGSPTTAAWLRDRIVASGATGTPASATLTLVSSGIDAHTGAITDVGVSRTFTIDLSE